MILFYQPGIKEGIHFLDPGESRHCVKVLRRKAGDALNLTDGRGTFYEAIITSADSQKCEFELTGERRAPEKNYHIHIALAPTRNIERTEWFVEKAVETGVDAVSFIRCAHAERTVVKPERLQKIAISAMKQSLRATLPEIHDIIPFTGFVGHRQEQQRFVASAGEGKSTHLMQQALRGKSYCVLIGPEGDFTSEEVRDAMDTGFQAVKLGNYRLRTETAALAATQILGLVNL